MGAERLNKLHHLLHTVLPTESDDAASSHHRGTPATRQQTRREQRTANALAAQSLAVEAAGLPRGRKHSAKLTWRRHYNESLGGVGDSSDQISREDSSRANGVCCLLQLN